MCVSGKNRFWTSELSLPRGSHSIHIMKPEPLYALLTQCRNVCVSAVCAPLTTSALAVITSVCRMNSPNRQCGVLFALMRRFPACMLLNVEIITTGKLPESRVIDCDSSVLNDPCVLLFRPVSRAKHGQDASADIHGHGGGIQGDLL